LRESRVLQRRNRTGEEGGTNLVDNEHPRLILGLVSLGYVRDGVLTFVVSGDIDFSALVVDSGDD
jgi:hypothetical protein